MTIAPLEQRLQSGSVIERQGAIAILAGLPGESARRVLSEWLDRLIAGQASPEIQLDLLEAAAKRSEPEFREKIKKYDSTKRRDDPLLAYSESLAGGDRERGRAIFTSRSDVECVRCHKVRGTGGEVGPELSGIGARLSRADLLESVLNPNKKIAEGFESVVLATSDGKVHTGILRGEDGKEVRLVTAEGKSVTVPKDSIEDRKRGLSAMPADVAAKLSKTELRDLIEFLASLKTAPRASQASGRYNGARLAPPTAAINPSSYRPPCPRPCPPPNRPRVSCQLLYPSWQSTCPRGPWSRRTCFFHVF